MQFELERQIMHAARLWENLESGCLEDQESDERMEYIQKRLLQFNREFI
jgi:hypothetical protein